MLPKLVFAAAAAILTGLMAQPSLAHADPANAYLAELQRRGLEYSTPDAAIKLGMATCQALQEGNSMAKVLKAVEDQGFTGHDTGTIVGAAAYNLCPDQLPTVEGFLANQGG